FFDLIAEVFPAISVSRDEIVYRFSGIRPLPASDAANPGQISRDYRIEVADRAGSRIVTLVGGKWTTFRSLGQTLADVALRLLRVPRVETTLGRTISGGADYPSSDRARDVWLRSRLPGAGARGSVLLSRYG